MLAVKVDAVMVAETATLPEGLRLYCIGDVHGRADLLAALLECIDHHHAIEPIAAAQEIHLGDMIDRGPDSREVLNLLSRPAPGRERILIQGNHEQRMLDLLEGNASCEQWLYEGGYETMVSYGVPREVLRAPINQAKAVAELRLRMGDHVDLLQSAQLVHRVGDFVFVHAGIDPARALDEQIDHDLTTIREPFLSHDGPLGFVVVHGHTPSARVTMRQHRIGVDTGAYATGRLSCLVLERGRGLVFCVSQHPLP